MGKKRKNLSHEEIWDDSALLESWDAALQEYQLYHSIHARGERVEDVLRDAQDSQEVVTISNGTAEELSPGLTNGLPHSDEFEDGEIEEGQVDDTSLVGVGAEEGRERSEVKDIKGAQVPHGMPDLLTTGVQDEGLKNLMMSWYYAGYYTGLYEGRQQSGSASAKGPDNNGRTDS
ncbi:MAG: hypothetical protein L6R41_007576 [Letrouitia leprolyta]|nr:MAG: hypothetical protein L6R41_007576 [Letrouitia leprolyta]